MVRINVGLPIVWEQNSLPDPPPTLVAPIPPPQLVAPVPPRNSLPPFRPNSRCTIPAPLVPGVHEFRSWSEHV